MLAPFKSWDHRDELRARLANDANWPPRPAVPPIAGGRKLLLPLPFSPLR